MDRVRVLAHDSLAGRDNLGPGGLAARQWLKVDLHNLDLQPLTPGTYEQAFPQGVNLCARLPGGDPQLAGEVVLIGAHNDHLGTVGAPHSQCHATKASKAKGDTICNGALDNATGVAVAIAAVHALAQRPQPPRRSVVLCLFDAEEDGLLGSHYFAQTQPLVPIANIAAMFSVDMVASEFLPGEMSSFATDAEYSDALRDAVKQANAAVGMQTWPVSSFFVGQEGGGRSDHLSFRQAGVPVLFLGSGATPAYPPPLDRVELVNQAKLLQIARHTTVLLALVANADARPGTEPNANKFA